MSTTKLSLTILVPGATMVSKEKSLKNFKKDNQEIIPEVHDTLRISLREGPNEKVYTIKIRKSIPAKQVINMSEEAYNYFVSNEKPYNFKGTGWANLSRNERLFWHCSQIAASLGGIVDSFEVLD